MSFIAPAGTHIALRTILSGLMSHRPATSAHLLAEAFSTYTHGQLSFLMVTGRAAMTLSLIALRRLASDDSRNEVVIPGYTCYSVAAAVERAGLVPRLCDVDPVTLAPVADELRKLDFRRILAVASANLYGLPNALTEMETIAREEDVFFLDDAAQALGATYAGRPVGSFGDAGIFSFDKGKNITTVSGGVIVSNNARLSALLEQSMASIPSVSAPRSLQLVLKLIGYSIFLRPHLYDLIRRLPLGLGETPYEPDIELCRYDSRLAGVALRQLRSLEAISDQRVQNARAMQQRLAVMPTIRLTRPLPTACAVYSRLPILVDPGRRDRLIVSLNNGGIGATASYPCALIDVPEVARRLPGDQKATPGARCLSRQIVTLPTHHYCPADLPDTVARIVESVT